MPKNNKSEITKGKWIIANYGLAIFGGKHKVKEIKFKNEGDMWTYYYNNYDNRRRN